MATPVPVVSMMYFLVSTPPNTVTAVNPAFSAISTKFAIGGESAILGWLGPSWGVAELANIKTTKETPTIELRNLSAEKRNPMMLAINTSSYGEPKLRSRRLGRRPFFTGLQPSAILAERNHP